MPKKTLKSKTSGASKRVKRSLFNELMTGEVPLAVLPHRLHTCHEIGRAHV